MEYYAKSKTKELLEKEKKKLMDLLLDAEEMLAEEPELEAVAEG